jgi:hypothetical protein
LSEKRPVSTVSALAPLAFFSADGYISALSQLVRDKPVNRMTTRKIHCVQTCVKGVGDARLKHAEVKIPHLDDFCATYVLLALHCFGSGTLQPDGFSLRLNKALGSPPWQ